MKFIKYVPHASKQLHKPTISKSDTDDKVGLGQTTSSHIDQTKDEGSQGESAQAKRCRIGKFAALDLSVQTRLELSSKSRKTLLATACVDMSERTITEARGSFCGVMLFVRHLTTCAHSI